MSPRISISLLGAQSDQRLLALARDGHERAFEALVQRYRRPLLRYCRRMGLSDARGEDVLQQAFLQAWLALARRVEVRELRPWLYRIVHNAAVNAMRGPGELYGELTEAVQAEAALSGESNLERTIAVREALGEVAELPRMQRQAIFLTAVDGQSHEEVASALGISHGALRGLLYRARATLRGAAAAITPPPLLEWAVGGGGASGPAAERLAELTAGGGAAGFAGLLLKGAVVAVTAGAIATGAGVVAGRDHAAGSPRRGVSSGLAQTPSVQLQGAGEGALLGRAVFSSPSPGVSRASGGRGGERRSPRSGGPRRADRRGGRDGGDRGGRDVPSSGGDASAEERDGGEGVAENSGARPEPAAATGTRSGSSGSGRSEPRTADGAKGTFGGNGASDATSEGAHGEGSVDVSESGRAGSGGSGSGGEDPDASAAPGLDSTTSSGTSGDESALAEERSSGESGRSDGHGGSGSDG
jgi:RNA polymerase sigma factor (sigma-70 family)